MKVGCRGGGCQPCLSANASQVGLPGASSVDRRMLLLAVMAVKWCIPNGIRPRHSVRHKSNEALLLT